MSQILTDAALARQSIYHQAALRQRLTGIADKVEALVHSLAGQDDAGKADLSAKLASVVGKRPLG